MSDRPKYAGGKAPSGIARDGFAAAYVRTPNEYTLVELPLIAYLRDELGYAYLSPEKVMLLRGGENQVLLRDHLVGALARINQVPEDEASAIASDLARRTDNAQWLAFLRGGYSRKLQGDKTHRPIKLIDFDNPSNNTFVVTNQLEVRGLSYRIPDVVVYVNGIPLVVVEAKSAIAKKDVFDAISDIRVYEKELPRLFATNLFNIATNGTSLRYGATGAPKELWASWRDPWPRSEADFAHEPMQKGLWSLLEKNRLLDILAHFVVFERDPDSGTTIKKMCRYQQLRAVNKLVERVAAGKHRRGLIWHTQGSGKSLTMVFATLKLKFHHGLSSPELQNPNLLVLTDRKDLDAQITKTFQDCGIPNPEHADSIERLHELVAGSPKGRVVLSTIFKAHGSRKPIADSGNWIILVDEAHRTQEKDLGGYLRATFPDARFFGFTGTPVKTKDLDTRKNFGVKGEDYLDRYGIEDAVADGATVPIRYMSRMALWELDAPKLDVMFDQEFAALDPDLRDELKARGVTRGDLARFEPRIGLIAYDIWTHFKKNVRPDGMKAQIVAVDRKACTIYKRCLDVLIAKELVKTEGLGEAEAMERAAAMSACVYSSGGKEDLKEGNEDLAKFYLDEEAEKAAKRRFKDPSDPLSFLIVCNKLLTGFDAPIEQAMYLDSYLTQHNLLQAIARTNRRYGEKKDHAIVVDYIGVTRDLKAALDSYDPKDVGDSMESDDALADDLRAKHAAAMAFLKGAPRSSKPEKDAQLACEHLGTEDVWYRFRPTAAAFLRAQAAVGSDPIRLEFTADAKYVATVIAWGSVRFEQKAQVDFKELSEKIRGMLEEHLEVTGLKTLVTLPSITDPGFWIGLGDGDSEEEDLETAALKKVAALKKTLAEKKAQNPAQYATLSERVQELIDSFTQKQIDAAELYRRTYEYAVQLVRKEVEYEETGLDRETHGFYSILTAELPPSVAIDGRRFTERGIRLIVEAFRSWTHPRCATTVPPYTLGGGDEVVAREIVELLEAIANAPMPKLVTDVEGEEAYADLAERVVRAPERVIRADDRERDDLGPWVAFVFLGVEPLLMKVMALLDPARTQAVLSKRVGLSTLVSELQKSKCIPYDLHLTPEQFESDEGWPERSAYDNAVRDVVAIRIAQAHKAPKHNREIWASALVMMLGVIEQNRDALTVALAALTKPPGTEQSRRDGDGPAGHLSEEEDGLRQVAGELATLFREDETAPVNWQLNPAVTKELRRRARRLLMRKVAKDKRNAILDAVMDHANRRFAKSRD